jgi:FKBP-type peptidyl-prolyl cis-trans isomerase 2
MRSLTRLPAPLLALLALLAPAFATETKTLDSGLTIEYTLPVTCSRPTKSGDRISVHYQGTLQSTGAEFDQSYRRGAPITFALGTHQVIDGWDQGLQNMCPGEKRRLVIPPSLAYGDRDKGAIPPGSTLVFETELVEIVGVKQESIATPTAPAAAEATATATATEAGAFSIATAPPTPPEGVEQDSKAETAGDASPHEPPKKPAECKLLGPFALLVQGALGAVALLTLVWKRYRETPKRPWRIFFYDVSKQVFGSVLTHVLNLAMSILGSVDMVNAAANVGTDSAKHDPQGRMPNPCSFYLLNLAIDVRFLMPAHTTLVA